MSAAGSYAIDNSHELRGEYGSYRESGAAFLPIEDDPLVIRQVEPQPPDRPPGRDGAADEL